MFNRFSFFIFVMMLAVVLAACGGEDNSDSGPTVTDLASETQTVPVNGSGAYTDVSASGLAAILETEDLPLINVHIPYAGEIEGTDEFIPFDQIEQNSDKLPADKDAKVVIYCRSGSMSGISARTLVEMGYTNVWNLDGGMVSWEASGQPIVSR